MKEKDKKRPGKKQTGEIEIISLELEPRERQSKASQGRAPKGQAHRQEETRQTRRKEGPGEKKIDNKEFMRVTYLFVGLFLAMMGYLVYFHVAQSRDIINSPYNVRLDSMADRVVRGQILDRDGAVLARTDVAEDGTETRIYPYGDVFAHVVGYDSHGKSGLESTANFQLLTSNAFFIERLAKEVREEKNIGDNVITTLDASVQQAAYDALGRYRGAVVVLEVSTGKILAMVSKPDFNPNTLAADWKEITTGEESVLLNRATQGLYAPGSVFKLVTTLAYMRENAHYENYHYQCEGEITHGDTTIHCAKNRVHGEESLSAALANSCNASFSDIGLSLNLSKYKNVAEDLLFNCELPSLLPYSKSRFPLNADAADAEVMMTAIGQGKTLVSPYHMALLSASIANGGILMEPYLVDCVENYTGASVKKYMPRKYTRLMKSEEATQLKEYMTAVVEAGTASALHGQSFTVAGKTGTAEYSSDKDKAHSWFMGFTNVDNPELAISVVVENADNSGMSAVTVAKKVLNAYY